MLYLSGVKCKIMCTVTLTYDQNNALARRKLAALLSTGLFMTISEQTNKEVEAEKQKDLEETKAFFDASKKSMSHIIARYL